jgi:putative flippase GtrA
LAPFTPGFQKGPLSWKRKKSISIRLFGWLSKDLIFKHQIKVKFAIVGIWNTIFGYLVFVGLDSLFTLLFFKRYTAYLVASFLANILAITNAYIFHKVVTFRSQVKGKSIFFEFARFSSTYIFTVFLGLVLLPVFVEMLFMDPKIAAAAIIPITLPFNYLGHSRFSFNKRGLPE